MTKFKSHKSTRTPLEGFKTTKQDTASYPDLSYSNKTCLSQWELSTTNMDVNIFVVIMQVLWVQFWRVITWSSADDWQGTYNNCWQTNPSFCMIRRHWYIYMNEMIEEKFCTFDNIACMIPNVASVIVNTKDASPKDFLYPQFNFVYNHNDIVTMGTFTTLHISSFTFWKTNVHPCFTLFVYISHVLNVRCTSMAFFFIKKSSPNWNRVGKWNMFMEQYSTNLYSFRQEWIGPAA